MSRKEKLVEELKVLSAVMLFFALWIAVLVLGKMLILAEYHISFSDWSVILVGSLILSKVVLILQHVPLGRWVSSQPAWVDLILRTALYALGLAVILLLEKAFDLRHEAGGFMAALTNLSQQTDINHVWANTLGLTGALFTFNFLNLLRMYIPGGSISRVLQQPPPNGQQME